MRSLDPEVITAVTKWNDHIHRQNIEVLTLRETHRQNRRDFERDQRNLDSNFQSRMQANDRAHQHNILERRAGIQEAERQHTARLLQAVPATLELVRRADERHHRAIKDIDLQYANRLFVNRCVAFGVVGLFCLVLLRLACLIMGW
ncbi:hypothetical protein B0T21DRAFT_366453 [Apiosordaria backusii]|uniref:Uncharacterized protein n=1 Tax=Apiosordaria backusii TaxID=314023 RepID=A0AA40BL05_9PEZI|nr:hypothetical protein B0T21DRAFT_366453 [Apiosordaria backusii]